MEIGFVNQSDNRHTNSFSTATVQDNAEHMPAGNPQFLNDCNKMVSSKESLTYDGKEVSNGSHHRDTRIYM